MTLAQMRYFQAVCTYESYTKAAEALYVSQPAISQAVRDLERECGIKLLSRKGNGLVVTEAGRILLEEIENILRHTENLEKLIAAQGLKRNFVRVGLSTLSSSAVFPRICGVFHKKYPDCRVFSHEASTSELFSLLDTARVDMIVTTPRMTKEELGVKYCEWVLNYSGLRYCVSSEHHWAKRSSVSLEEIAKEPLIMISENYNAHRRLKKLFADHGLEPNIIMTTSQMFTIERFVESGAAGGFLPPEVTAYNRHIKALGFPDDQPMNRTSIIWRRDAELFPAAEKMIRLAKQMYPAPAQP